MKTTSLITMTLSAFIIAACHSTKKNTSTSAVPAEKNSASVTTSSTSASPGPAIMVKSSEGINAPGEAELTAIQVKYTDVTLDKLKEGHALYTQGACTKCHEPKNIYKRGEAQWKTIIEDMAQKARLSETQKDAVYKYVLSIKATQQK